MAFHFPPSLSGKFPRLHRNWEYNELLLTQHPASTSIKILAYFIYSPSKTFGWSIWSYMLQYLSLKKYSFMGVPGRLSRLSVRLQLRSWSHGLWIRAPRQALCRQLRAWSLLLILGLPLSLLLPHPHFVSLCLSKISKCKKKFFLNNKNKESLSQADGLHG